MEDNNEHKQNLVNIYIYCVQVFDLLKSKWLTLLLFIVLGVIGGWSVHSMKGIAYYAKSQIIIESKSGNSGGLGSLLSFASQLGVSGGGALDEEKVGKLVYTKSIIYTALLDSVEIEGKHDLLVNHYIKLQYDSLRTRECSVITNSNYRLLDLKESLLLKNIYSEFTSERNGLLAVEKGKEGIISIAVLLKNEQLSYWLNIKIVEAIDNFYGEKLKSKEATTIGVLEIKLDSIKNEIEFLENEYMSWKERNATAMNAQALVEDMRYQRKLQIYNTMYVETFKSIEIKKINSQFEEDYIRQVDFPSLPLIPSKYSMKKFLLIGAILALILGVVFVVVSELIKDIKRSAVRAE